MKHVNLTHQGTNRGLFCVTVLGVVGVETHHHGLGEMSLDCPGHRLRKNGARDHEKSDRITIFSI